MSLSFLNSRVFPRSRSLANLHAAFSHHQSPYTHVAGAHTEPALHEDPDDSITALPSHPMAGQSGEKKSKSEQTKREDEGRKKVKKTRKTEKKVIKNKKQESTEEENQEKEDKKAKKEKKKKKSKAKAQKASKWSRIKATFSTTWKRLAEKNPKPVVESSEMVIGTPTDFKHIGGVEILAGGGGGAGAGAGAGAGGVPGGVPGGVVGGGEEVEERESDWVDTSEEE